MTMKELSIRSPKFLEGTRKPSGLDKFARRIVRERLKSVHVGQIVVSEGGRHETFGNLTHAFSTYESYREDQGDPDTPFARGINSIQLILHRGRYWITSISWDSERPGNPIPDRYIGGR